jgi:hypothetical protein
MSESKSFRLGREYGEFWAGQVEDDVIELLDNIDWGLAHKGAFGTTWDAVKGELEGCMEPENAATDTDMDEWAEGFLQGVAVARNAD